MLFVPCPKQGYKIKGIVLNRVCILGLLCAKQGQEFKPSVAHLYANIGRVPPLLPPGTPACSRCACSVSIRPFIRGKITLVLTAPNTCSSMRGVLAKSRLNVPFIQNQGLKLKKSSGCL